jgi:hypothetical protein
VGKDEKIRGNFFKPNGPTSRNIWLLSYTKYKMVINIKKLVSVLVPVRYEILTAVLMMIDDQAVGSLLDPEDAGTMFLQNISNYLLVDTAKHTRKLETSSILNPFLTQDTLDFTST